MAGSHEIELKFQVPPGSVAALRRAVGTATARTTPLQAVYADSADARLAAAGLALRLRREGDAWVQTLKGRGDGLLQRLEHEVPLPAGAGEPRLDPDRHAGTAAGAALQAALRGAELLPQYRTDIRRLHRVLRRSGSHIEIAFDEGRIVAGEASLAVCEIEFELKRGSVEVLLQVAADWVRRHGLWLDVRTKSERGFRLARKLDQVAAVRAEQGPVVSGGQRHEVFRSALMASLAQALPNAAEIAAGTARPEHLHQLRVALRRLRTVLRLLADWGADAARASALEAAWQGVFAELGGARDTDAVEAAFGARLRATMQALSLPPALPATTDTEAATAADPGARLRDPCFTLQVLATLQLAHAPPAPLQPGEAPLRECAAEVLQQAWRAAVRDARHFERAGVEARHRLRKRLKRLRYAAEFLLPVFAPARGERTLKPLRAALEALGGWHDLQVAQTHCAKRAGTDPQAAFVLGWLAAQGPAQDRRCAKALRRWVDAPRFWR